MSDIIKQAIPNIHDWPEPGVIYRDITGLVTDPEAFDLSCQLLVDKMRGWVDCIAAADARGFIWGGVVAHQLGIPLHLIRKPGKLPPPTYSHEFEYEYAKTSLHIRASARIDESVRVGIIDDVNATGGTALAIIDLIKSFNVPLGNIKYSCIIDLPYLGGSDKIKALGVSFFAATTYNE